MITVHGRTRCQFYKGQANWAAVRNVREAINLPLVVNGDIINQTNALDALEKSGADAVMIGRGAYGAPWLPAHIGGVLSSEEAEALRTNCQVVVSHHEAMLSFYGVESGIRQARKHLGWYLDNLNLPTSSGVLKKIIMTSFEPSEIYKTLEELFAMHEKSNVSAVAA